MVYTAAARQLKIAGRSIGTGTNTSQNATLEMENDWTFGRVVGPLFFFRAGDSLDFRWLTQQRDDFIRTHPDSNLPLSQGRLRFNSCMLRPSAPKFCGHGADDEDQCQYADAD